jgi:hypothetical protein
MMELKKEYKELKVIFSGSLERILLNELEILEITKYAIITEMKVSWNEKVKHLNTHIWPGKDDTLIVIDEKEKIYKFIEVLEILKKNLDYDATFTISVTPLEYFSE